MRKKILTSLLLIIALSQVGVSQSINRHGSSEMRIQVYGGLFSYGGEGSSSTTNLVSGNAGFGTYFLPEVMYGRESRPSYGIGLSGQKN